MGSSNYYYYYYIVLNYKKIGNLKGGDPRGGMVLDVHGHFPTFAQNPLSHV